MKFNKLPHHNFQLFSAILLMLAFGLACFVPFVRQVKAQPLTLDGVTYDTTTHECTVSGVVDAQALRALFKQDLDANKHIFLHKITFEDGSGLTGDASFLFSPFLNNGSIDDSQQSLNNNWQSYLDEKGDEGNRGTITSHLESAIFPSANFTFTVTNMSYMFYNCDILQSLDLSGLTTSQITSMKALFYSCVELASVNLSSFTSDNLQNVESMFGYCEALTDIIMPNFSITSNITSLTSLFENCHALKTIQLKSWDTSNVTDMDGVFWSCNSLENLDFLTQFNTTNVVEMKAMFGDTNILPDISRFNTPNLRDISGMFMGAKYIPDITVLDTSHVVAAHALFAGCTNLTSIPEWLPRFNTSSMQIFSCMFAGWTGLTSFTLPKLDMSQATDIHGMLAGQWTTFAPVGTCKIQHLDFSNINTSKVTNFVGLFEGQCSVEELDLTPLDTTYMHDLAGMFQNCTKLKTIKFGNYNTSKVIDTSLLFANCANITSLDLSFFDTSNVTSMAGMFTNCEKLSYLNIKSFTTSKVTDMSQMFAGCPLIQDYSVLLQFDTSNVTNMSGMFENDYFIKNLDFSHFDFSKVAFTSQMFQNCQALESLDLSTLPTDAIREHQYATTSSIDQMFAGCARLKTLDLSQFNLKDVVVTPEVFSNTPCLQTIKTCGGFNQGSKNVCPKGSSWSIYDSETDALLYGPGELTQEVFANFSATQPITISNEAPSLVWNNETQTYYVKGVFEETDLCDAWNHVGPVDVKHVVFENGSGLTGSGLGALCGGFTYLETVDFPSNPDQFDAKTLRSFAEAFANCPNLVIVNMASVVTESLTSLKDMFINDTSLRSVNIANFGFNGSPNTGDMFKNTPSLAYAALPKTLSNAKNPGYPEGSDWFAYANVDEEPYWGPGTISASVLADCPTTVVTFAKNGFGWQKDEDGNWWYLEKDGSFPRNEWKWIVDSDGEHWYHFNEAGNLQTNLWFWDASENSWYYCGETGAMLTGCWAWLDDAWYGFWWNGKMCKGWVWDADWQAWYYCDDSGVMQKGCWSWIDNEWYGFFWDGKMCQGWIWDADWQAWFYCFNNGVMARNMWIDGYWVNDSGVWVH